MAICLGKSCSFGLPRVPFVNCCQFMYLVISLLVLRAGCGIWLYQFLIIAYLFTLCPCLPDQTRRMTALRVCTIFRWYLDLYSPWLKDEHEKISEMGFRRFWARRESYVVQKTHIHVGSTGPVFAPYWSVGCSKACTASAWARTASKEAPSEIRGIHVQVHAILGQKSQEHTENRDHACDNCIAGGWFRTDLPRTTDFYGFPSLTSRSTLVCLMHAT